VRSKVSLEQTAALSRPRHASWLGSVCGQAAVGAGGWRISASPRPRIVRGRALFILPPLWPPLLEHTIVVNYTVCCTCTHDARPECHTSYTKIHIRAGSGSGHGDPAHVHRAGFIFFICETSDAPVTKK